jgi:hypothetical protein
MQFVPTPLIADGVSNATKSVVNPLQALFKPPPEKFPTH